MKQKKIKRIEYVFFIIKNMDNIMKIIKSIRQTIKVGVKVGSNAMPIKSIQEDNNIMDIMNNEVINFKNFIVQSP